MIYRLPVQFCNFVILALRGEPVLARSPSPPSKMVQVAIWWNFRWRAPIGSQPIEKRLVDRDAWTARLGELGGSPRSRSIAMPLGGSIAARPVRRCSYASDHRADHRADHRGGWHNERGHGRCSPHGSHLSNSLWAKRPSAYRSCARHSMPRRRARPRKVSASNQCLPR